MVVQLKTENSMKAVSVSAHCKQLNISRSQYYWHVKKGTFHAPLHLTSNNRPYLTASMVEDNLRVRETGVSVTGEFVIFYERQRKSETKRPKANQSSLMEGLRTLGLNAITTDQVESALAITFPNGTEGQDEANVLRVVFRHLKRSGVA